MAGTQTELFGSQAGSQSVLVLMVAVLVPVDPHRCLLCLSAHWYSGGTGGSHQQQQQQILHTGILRLAVFTDGGSD